MTRFMVGRYGTDDLAKFLLGTSVVCIILNLFLRINLLNYVVVLLIVVIYWRMFSKNIQKRYEENVRYLRVKNNLIGKFQKQKSMLLDRKTNHIYKCPNCKQKIRIPRGKGKIMITCPKCRTEFTKKS